MTSMERFFLMLARVPYLVPLWDQHALELRLEAFEQALGTMSSGERQMALFFAAVWFGHGGRYGFDLVEALRSLDDTNRRIIHDWVADPFYP